LPYDNQANTAQEKLATVQLVLAALLAAPNPRGRVLVLDELGDSLGLSHRREVLREISQTAQAKGVTVLGTCQDSVLGDAASFCGELVYFEYPSLTEALNRPTRMFGFDDNGERVELTSEALTSGREWL
jgi:ABC-type hemin transport system ATPase subunit